MANTFTSLIYHVIFSTKGRQPIITEPPRTDLERYIGGIVRRENGVALAVGSMPDHIHLLIQLRADTSPAEMMRVVKSNSSKWVNERTGQRGAFAWQSGYGAFTVSRSQVEAVRHYVLGQEDHHRVRSFQEEFLEFLRRNEIAFDERYVWD